MKRLGRERSYVASLPGQDGQVRTQVFVNPRNFAERARELASLEREQAMQSRQDVHRQLEEMRLRVLELQQRLGQSGLSDPAVPPAAVPPAMPKGGSQS